MAIAEITKSESAQRAGLLRVRSCDVVLDLTRGDGEFGSESVIRFDCAEPGAASYADLVARTVHEITLNGRPARPGTGLRRRPDRAAGPRRQQRAARACRLRLYRRRFGARTASDRLGRRQGRTASRQLFPADARRVFACFDQPDLKAEFDITVTAPAGWVVLSNMPSPAAEPVGRRHCDLAV